MYRQHDRHAGVRTLVLGLIAGMLCLAAEPAAAERDLPRANGGASIHDVGAMPAQPLTQPEPETAVASVPP
jgi:hypothetical protein